MSKKWLESFKNDTSIELPAELEAEVFSGYESDLFIKDFPIKENLNFHNKLLLMYFIRHPETSGDLIERYAKIPEFSPPMEIVNDIVDKYQNGDIKLNLTRGVVKSLHKSILKLTEQLVAFGEIDDASDSFYALLLLTDTNLANLVDAFIVGLNVTVKNKILSNINHNVIKISSQINYYWLKRFDWFWTEPKINDWINKYEKILLDYNESTNKDKESIHKQMTDFIYTLNNIDFNGQYQYYVKNVIKEKLLTYLEVFPCKSMENLFGVKFVLFFILNKLNPNSHFNVNETYEKIKNNNNDEYNHKIKVAICEALVSYFKEMKVYQYQWQTLIKSICLEIMKKEGWEDIVIKSIMATGDFDYLNNDVIPKISDEKIENVYEMIEKTKELMLGFPVHVQKRAIMEIDDTLLNINKRIAKGIKVKFCKIKIGNIFEAHNMTFQKIYESNLYKVGIGTMINCMDWKELKFYFQEEDQICTYYPLATLKVNGI